MNCGRNLSSRRGKEEELINRTGIEHLKEDQGIKRKQKLKRRNDEAEVDLEESDEIKRGFHLGINHLCITKTAAKSH